MLLLKFFIWTDLRAKCVQRIPGRGALVITLHLIQLQVVLILYIHVNMLCGKTRAFQALKILRSSICLLVAVFFDFSKERFNTLSWSMAVVSPIALFLLHLCNNTLGTLQSPLGVLCLCLKFAVQQIRSRWK